MLQRLLIILLMLVVPIQGFAVPHSHGPMVGMQPDEHNQRPHLHLGGHYHHGHSHDDEHSQNPCPYENPGGEPGASTSEVPTQPNDHDDDVLNASGEFGLNPTQTLQTVAEPGLDFWIEAVQPTTIDARSSEDPFPLFLARGDTRIYLTTLSLRL